MITFSCSRCQKPLGVRDEYAGRQVRCGGCGQILVAPAAPGALHAVAVAEATPAPETPPPETPPSETPPPAKPPPAKPRLTTEDTHAFDAVPAGNLNTVYSDPARFSPLPRLAAQIGTAGALETRYAETEENRPDSGVIEFLSPARAADEIGRLGKYRVLSILGRGGMGVVLQAEDTLLKRPVALKAIKPSLAAGAAVRKRFFREARAMARLEHEHVVRLYEVNEEASVPYIAMELLSGEPLQKRLKREPVLPPSEALRIGREVAEVLAVAHAREMIHRDIKPGNIFLEGSAGRVKLLDFGLVSAVEEDSRLTQSGTVLGTPAYMAPEQGRGDRVDCRCDLFSLGVVLYRMSTGREPFVGKDALTTIMAAANDIPPAPRVQNAKLPADLSDLIMRLLAKNPAERGTAEQAVEALTRIQRGEPASLPVLAQPAPANTEVAERPPVVIERPARPASGAGTLPWLLIGGILAVLLLCVAVPLVVVVLLLIL